ncbi:hypothetical protein MRX96_005411 [Rhipicephalus microplus]
MDVDGEHDNETWDCDAGLQFSDLSLDERGRLLRARSAGVVAYCDSSLGNDSPENSAEASCAVSGNEVDEAVEDLASRLSNMTLEQISKSPRHRPADDEASQEDRLQYARPT